MPRKEPRPSLGGLSSDDTDRIRAFGLSRGFLPTQADPAPAPAPPPAEATAPPAPAPAPATTPAPAPVFVRPAATRPWQAMFPDYLIEALRQAAAREGTAQKVVVLRALRAVGFRVDDIDMQDLRRR